jgi:DNA invertase Pin-like site-specific DNA recombinase
MKVFAYLRVSGEVQTDKGGFERQLDTIYKFCEAKGFLAVRRFHDQQSGADEFADRRALHEVLALAGSGSATGIDTIVIERADRIARDLMVQEIFLRECHKKGIKVYAADSGEELVLAGADPTRVLIRQILGALAQWEKSQINMKLQAGRRKKARETGKPCGGPAPYGETPSEKAVVKTIWKLRRHEHRTFLQIANYLTNQGFPTPAKGSYWPASTVQKIYRREENLAAAINVALQDGDQ